MSRRRVWGRRLALGAVVLGVTVCAVAAYLLLWGRYSPYSPVVLGFDRIEQPHAVVFVERDGETGAAQAAGTSAGLPRPDPTAVDALVGDVERTHGLTFKSRPRLLFFSDPGTYSRRTTTRARACTYYNGTVVVSPWVQREDAAGTLSLEVYLRHELSHALLYQRMGLLAALRYPKWLLEGVATWSAGQMGTSAYPSAEETRALIAAGSWMPPDVYHTAGEDDVPLAVTDRMTFMYSEFACLVDDLVAHYGRERFFAYVRALMEDGDHDAVFRRTFGVGFDEYLSAFRARVASGAGGGSAGAGTRPEAAHAGDGR